MELKTKTKRAFRSKSLREAKLKNDAAVEQLAATAWNFTYAALWSNCQFSAKEENTAKEAITSFFNLFKIPEKGFSVFCQRVALAKIESGKSQPVITPLPSHWLDWRNDDGFISTKQLFDSIEKTRASLPLYKIELKALSEGVLEFAQEPTKENFHYWQQYFIERKHSSILTLFRLAAVQQLYKA
jgi:hypothetical protein